MFVDGYVQHAVQVTSCINPQLDRMVSAACMVTKVATLAGVLADVARLVSVLHAACVYSI